jgi:hypothetical protein
MLRRRWIVNWRISRRTVNRRLNNARCRARIPIKHPLCPQYVPVKMMCFSVSIRGRGHQLDSTKNDFHPTSVLSATTWCKTVQQEAIELLPWPAMSPDMNLIKHLWDYLGRKVNARTFLFSLIHPDVGEIPAVFSHISSLLFFFMYARENYVTNTSYFGNYGV